MSSEEEEGTDPEGSTASGEEDAGRDIHATDDATLGGYFRKHDRPPAFEGIDGHPYTVSVEAERQPDLREPWAGFLVFPRWARTGVGIVGHVVTPLCWTGRTREEVERQAGKASLAEVKRLLDDAIRAGTEHEDEDRPEAGDRPDRPTS